VKYHFSDIGIEEANCKRAPKCLLSLSRHAPHRSNLQWCLRASAGGTRDVQRLGSRALWRCEPRADARTRI